MKKKLISLLLTVIMTIGVFSGSVLAADATVKTLEITDVIEPVLNTAAVEYYKIPDNAGYSYDSYDESYIPCSWTYNATKPETYDDIIYNGESIYTHESKGFTKAGYYTFIAYLRTEEGYTVADDATATVNGKAAKVIKGRYDNITVYYTFDYIADIDFADIASVDISGVSAPIDGAIGKFGYAVSDTEKYSAFNYGDAELNYDPSVMWFVTDSKPQSWADVENGEYFFSDSEFKFEKGKFYTFVIRITANSGYEFTDKTAFKINSFDAKSELITKFEADVWYTFEVADKKLVKSVAISNVKPPALNEVIEFGGNIETDMGYIYNYGVWYATENKPESLEEVYDGLLIYNNLVYYPDKTITEEFFSDKYYYTFYAFIEADGGYFDPALTATINGKTAQLDADSLNKGIAGVYYTFDKLPSADDEKPPVSDKKLASIKVTRNPDKLVYSYGEELDTAGLVVEATYSDGSYAGVIDNSNLNFDGFDTTSQGKKTVTIKYEKLEASFDIEVEFTFWQWVMYIVLFGWIWM